MHYWVGEFTSSKDNGRHIGIVIRSERRLSFFVLYQNLIIQNVSLQSCLVLVIGKLPGAASRRWSPECVPWACRLVVLRLFANFSITVVQSTRYRPGASRRYAPRRWHFDGGRNRGGSTSVRGRVRSPYISDGRRWLSCRQPACL